MDDAFRNVYRAIADPTRRKMIRLLAKKSSSVNGLSKHFDVSRQAISLHVKTLSECGVIAVSQQGRERVCELKPKKLAEVWRWLDSFRMLWDADDKRNDDGLNKSKKLKK